MPGALSIDNRHILKEFFELIESIFKKYFALLNHNPFTARNYFAKHLNKLKHYVIRTIRHFLLPATLTMSLQVTASLDAADFAERDTIAARESLAQSLNDKLAKPLPTLDLAAFGERLRRRLIDPEQFGIPAVVTDPTLGYDEGAYAPIYSPGRIAPGIRAAADRLLTDTAIGQPGKVDWNNVKSRFGPWALTPLALAFLETGENQYLQRWCDYLDDWSLHESTRLWPIECPPEYSKGAPATLHLIKLWGGIARRLEHQPDRFPWASLLRSLNKLLPDYPLMSAAYHRGNPRNWTAENAYFYSELGFYLEDFSIGQELLREGLRVIESYSVTHNMRDGTENQQMLGYNLMYLRSATKSAALWEAARKTGHLSPEASKLNDRFAWREILLANARDRAIRMIRMVTPEGRAPATLRTDLRDYPLNGIAELFPERALDAESLAILQWFRARRKNPAPRITSEHFPYGGYTTMRSGWDSLHSHGFLFSSPQPGAAAGYNSEKNNNTLTIAAFGDDIIVSGDRGAYTKRPSPLRIDGREQAFHLGLMAPLAAWDTPSQTRFHSSEDFVLAEGIYSGPYGRRPPRSAGPDAQQAALQSALRNATHTRIAILAKPSTWLVFDQVAAPGSHENTLDWRLPLAPASGRGSYGPFLRENIQSIDSPLPQIQAHRADGANVHLAFVATTPIRLQTTEERRQGTPVSDFLRISASWRQPESGGILSLIQPWRGNANHPSPPEDLSNDQFIGLASRSKDGTRLVAQMARSTAAILQEKELSATAQLLVVQNSADGEINGILLGCRSLRWKNLAIQIQSEDFAFRRSAGGHWNFTPIFRPVAAVQIHPSRALLASNEPITLTCPTPDTDIHYTLDGTPVTRDSPRYVSPLMSNDSVWLKARAFRREANEQTPFEHNTLASPESRAALSLATSYWPAIEPRSFLRPGWNQQSGRGHWSDLWLKGKGGPKGPDSVREQSAVLQIPETGVYTFHAPESWTHDNRIGGYDLRLTLDGTEWFPETQRHAFGTWSVPLEKGPHRITIRYVDFRRDAVAKFNTPGARLNLVWEGDLPEIKISGPTLPTPQAIPAKWIYHE